MSKPRTSAVNMDWYYKENDPKFYAQYKADGFTAYRCDDVKNPWLEHPDYGVMTFALFNAINSA